jgi:transcriptional regulator with XRE-family HTH domain
MPRRRQDIPEEYLNYQRDLAVEIGTRIRQRRTELGLSQATVREKMELSSVYCTRAQFSRIENGVFLPDAAQVIALSEVLGVSCSWLLTGKQE